MASINDAKYSSTAVDRLIASLRDIKSETTDPSMLAKVNYCLSLTEGIEVYLEQKCSPLPAIATTIFEDTIKENWADHFENGRLSCIPPLTMLTETVEGTILRLMTQIAHAETILEIGMFTGHSAVCLGDSRHVKELVCLELEPLFQEFLEERIKGTDLETKTRIIIGHALDSLRKLKTEGKKFDLVFIDADKPNYLNYYKFIMDEGLLSPTGFFLVDNVLWSGRVISESETGTGMIINEFNTFVQNDSRVEQCILPLRDGVSIITQKPTHHGD